MEAGQIICKQTVFPAWFAHQNLGCKHVITHGVHIMATKKQGLRTDDNFPPSKASSAADRNCPDPTCQACTFIQSP